ncbi:MAG: PEGA domain-containing protein, partial [Myxococcota bacterium]
APKRRGMVIASLAAAALVGVGGAAMFASGSNASVRIATQPVGAQAFLDGDRALGATPIELANLEPGEHTIRLVEEGYEPLEARFEARTDAPTDLRFTLEREERSDTMPVVVPPAPVAEVEASAENATADSAARDGTATDNTDLENRAESGDAENTVADGADPQARGTRMIRPRRGGGARRAAQRPNDSTEMAEAEMAPSAMTSPPETPAAADGELTIMSLPWSSVSVDGQRPRSTPLRRLRLSAGRHAIRYRVQGEGDERSTSVVIEPGGTQTLRLDTR